MFGAQDPFSYRKDPAVPAFPDDHPIVIYDGKCRLCSGFVRFVLRHDRAHQFRFIAAQSPIGAALYRHYGLNPIEYQTNILLEHGRPWFKTEGSIRMFEKLGLPWSLSFMGRIVPRSLRDPAYDVIARNRLRWFGVRSTCLMQDSGHEERFLG